MFVINGNRVTLTRGNTFEAVVGMTNRETGEAYVPQEGDVVRFGMKKNAKDKTCVIEKVIPNDTLALYIAPSETQGLPVGNYVYDLELTYADGNVDTFVNEAPFILAQDVI